MDFGALRRVREAKEKEKVWACEEKFWGSKEGAFVYLSGLMDELIIL